MKCQAVREFTKPGKYSTTTYLDWVQLHAGLHDVDGREGPVRDGTTNTAGRGTLDIVHGIILGERIGRRGEEDLSWSIHGR